MLLNNLCSFKFSWPSFIFRPLIPVGVAGRCNFLSVLCYRQSMRPEDVSHVVDPPHSWSSSCFLSILSMGVHTIAGWSGRIRMRWSHNFTHCWSIYCRIGSTVVLISSFWILSLLVLLTAFLRYLISQVTSFC